MNDERAYRRKKNSFALNSFRPQNIKFTRKNRFEHSSRAKQSRHRFESLRKESKSSKFFERVIRKECHMKQFHKIFETGFTETNFRVALSLPVRDFPRKFFPAGISLFTVNDIYCRLGDRTSRLVIGGLSEHDFHVC